MPLVKRDANKNFVESYEIKNFNVDLDHLTVRVSLTYHKMTDKGLPSSSVLLYEITDRVELTTQEVSKTVQSTKRSEDGSIIIDANGNPEMETEEAMVQTTVPVEIKAFSEIISSMTTGGTLYKEIQTAIYTSFQKYQLKDDTFKIE